MIVSHQIWFHSVNIFHGPAINFNQDQHHRSPTGSSFYWQITTTNAKLIKLSCGFKSEELLIGRLWIWFWMNVLLVDPELIFALWNQISPVDDVSQCLWRTGCFRHSSLLPDTMGIWFSMWKRTRCPTLRNTWSRVRTWSQTGKKIKTGLCVCVFKVKCHNSYLSMGVNQQQVAHRGSLHATEDVLTGGRAALSDQEIPTTGEERLCLLSA